MLNRYQANGESDSHIEARITLASANPEETMARASKSSRGAERRATPLKTARSARKSWIIGTAAAVVILAAVVSTVVLTRGRNTTPPKPISQADANQRDCVLTDPGDSTLPTVLSGLDQAAKTSGHIDVQQFAVPASANDATPYLNSLIQQRCILIVALGDEAADAVRAHVSAATQDSAIRFVVVGQDSIASPAVTTIATNALTTSAITDAALKAAS